METYRLASVPKFEMEIEMLVLTQMLVTSNLHLHLV